MPLCFNLETAVKYKIHITFTQHTEIYSYIYVLIRCNICFHPLWSFYLSSLPPTLSHLYAYIFLSFLSLCRLLSTTSFYLPLYILLSPYPLSSLPIHPLNPLMHSLSLPISPLSTHLCAVCEIPPQPNLDPPPASGRLPPPSPAAIPRHHSLFCSYRRHVACTRVFRTCSESTSEVAALSRVTRHSQR